MTILKFLYVLVGEGNPRIGVSQNPRASGKGLKLREGQKREDRGSVEMMVKCNSISLNNQSISAGVNST
jgi:hypothetical protein